MNTNRLGSRQRLKHVVVIGCFSLVLCIFVCSLQHQIPSIVQTKAIVNRTKVILLWTTWFGDRLWFHSKSQIGRHLSKAELCPYTDCVFTNDQSRLKEADVVLFHYNDAPNWPRTRYSHQYYAHHNHEPPGDRGLFTFLGKYEGRINITISYRHDADLYVPYAVLLPVKNSLVYKPRIPLASKRKMAVWPVGHCSTSSKREAYVRELSKYIDVDIYGTCGTHRCPKWRWNSCFKSWERAYKFYLSFENNICRDYATEKLFLPLGYELIPVVLGGGNYSRDAPPHSVIDVRDFDSPKDLAQFLIKLAADEKGYYGYFEWKRKFKTVQMLPWFPCR